MGVISLIGLAIISGLVTLHFWRINKFKQALVRNLTEDEIKAFNEGNPIFIGENGKHEVANNAIQMQPYDERFEISMDKIQIGLCIF